jgi:hypothetical protein
MRSPLRARPRTKGVRACRMAFVTSSLVSSSRVPAVSASSGQRHLRTNRRAAPAELGSGFSSRCQAVASAALRASISPRVPVQDMPMVRSRHPSRSPLTRRRPSRSSTTGPRVEDLLPGPAYGSWSAKPCCRRSLSPMVVLNGPGAERAIGEEAERHPREPGPRGGRAERMSGPDSRSSYPGSDRATPAPAGAHYGRRRSQALRPAGVAQPRTTVSTTEPA